MRKLKFVLATLLVLCVALAAAAYVYLYVVPKGPELTQPAPMSQGKSSFVMRAHDGAQKRTIRVWTYRPASWRPDGAVLLVMHGMGRNGENYLDAWTETAERRNILLLAPEFDNAFARFVTNDYQEGNLFTAYGRANPQSEWAYATIERVIDQLNDANNWSIDAYDMFGHSAGGQFVQRMVTLFPSSRLRTGVAANAGSYTFPDATIAFPYGLKDVPASALDPARSYAKRLVVLLGDQDTSAEQGVLDQSKPAMLQGQHRFERGGRFFEAARERAAEQKLDFAWELVIVPGVGHDYRKMSEAAADLF